MCIKLLYYHQQTIILIGKNTFGIKKIKYKNTTIE